MAQVTQIADKLLKEIIEQEFDRLEQTGHKIKLKSVRKTRIKLTIIFGLLFLLFLFLLPVVSFIIMIIYYVKLYKANNINAIINLAKNSPDSPISDIIIGDMDI